MNLIKSFKSLLEGGVILHFKVAAAGEGKVQMDILPVGKDTKTGVGLPAKALVGTPEELDAELEPFMQKYVATVSTVARVVAEADVELKEIEEAAKAQTKAAVTAKRPAAPGKPAIKGTSGPAAKRDMRAGLITGDEETDADGDDSPGTGGGEDASITLNTGAGTATEAAPAAAGGQQGEPASGLTADVFSMV